MYCYNLNGRFLWSVSPVFVSGHKDIVDFDLDPLAKVLKIFDGGSIHFFDLDGVYLKSTSAQVLGNKIGSLGATGIVVYNPYYDTSSLDFYKIKIVNEKGNIVATAWPHNVYSPFSNIGMLNLMKNFDSSSLLYSELLNDTIYSINEHSIQRAYWVDFGKHRIKNQSLYHGKDLGQVFNMLNKNHESGAIDLLFESDRFFHCAFILDGKYVSCYYDKRNGRTFLVKPKTGDPFWEAFPVLPIAVLPDSRFVFVVEPQVEHLQRFLSV